MSRKLTSAAVLLSSTIAIAASATAQDQEAGRARLERPEPANLQVQPAPPQLMQLLQNWSNASASIQKLQGEHQRWVFDHVFQVEKRAVGVFYYEAPDKGRIDLRPAEIRRGQQSERKDAKGNRYKLEADRAERWICNGQEIWQVNDPEKTIEIFPIPPANQGANIMDGPLPFLFGMPPDKALRRYRMEITEPPADKKVPGQSWLTVHPRWQQDASNWREALVILDTTRWLPVAVRLIDPAGNLETVYSFSKLEPNKSDHLGWIRQVFPGTDKDVFRPELRGYRRNIVQAQASVEQPQRDVVPSVMNFRWEDAKSQLEKAGYKAKPLRGQATARTELTYVVYEQNPKPGTPLSKGETVSLTLYDKPAAQQR